MIEHFGKDEIVGLLRAIHDALAPGGAVIIRTINCSSILGSDVRYTDFTHETGFTERSLRQVLMACGFKRILITDGKVPLRWRPKRLVRWSLLKLWRIALRIILASEVGGPVHVCWERTLSLRHLNGQSASCKRGLPSRHAIVHMTDDEPYNWVDPRCRGCDCLCTASDVTGVGRLAAMGAVSRAKLIHAHCKGVVRRTWVQEAVMRPDWPQFSDAKARGRMD